MRCRSGRFSVQDLEIHQQCALNSALIVIADDEVTIVDVMCNAFKIVQAPGGTLGGKGQDFGYHLNLAFSVRSE